VLAGHGTLLIPAFSLGFRDILAWSGDEKQPWLSSSCRQPTLMCSDQKQQPGEGHPEAGGHKETDGQPAHDNRVLAVLGIVVSRGFGVLGFDRGTASGDGRYLRIVTDGMSVYCPGLFDAACWSSVFQQKCSEQTHANWLG